MSDEPEKDENQGPSLKLLFSLVALALVAAIVIAMKIVYRFYILR